MELLSSKARGCYWPLQAAAVIVVAGLALTGCHKPIMQQSPSLNLPGPVANLAAIRGDNMVWLAWTMPRKTMDRRKIKGDIIVRICRRDGPSGDCVDVGKPLVSAPGATGSFSELLPAELTSGTPRPLCYFLELKNGNGRSAGLINSVWTLAGSQPFPVLGLTVEIHEDAVLLRWMPAPSGENPENTVIRLYRKLATPDPSTQNSSTPPSQMTDQKLVVEVGGESERALDKDVHIGKIYEYRAQRVARVTVNGQMLELAGELSPPVSIRFE
jgi:hypothetical protein